MNCFALRINYVAVAVPLRRSDAASRKQSPVFPAQMRNKSDV